MDSENDLLEQLKEEGQGFTWDSFCYPNEDFPGEYGGDDKPEWLAWKTRAFNTISRIASESSPALTLAKQGLAVATRGNGPDKFERAKATLLKGIELALSSLQEDSYGEIKKPESSNKSSVLSNKVFVVHGHDSALKTDVERFLREVGLEPIVLHRQPDQGATVIEKFEKHSDVGYAFILLTPDEIAYLASKELLPDGERSTEYRARPNVIFEFGYFVGKLGRKRVCALVKGDVSVPSDLAGLVYKAVDDSLDPLAYSIIRELKAAGYEIRM